MLLLHNNICAIYQTNRTNFAKKLDKPSEFVIVSNQIELFIEHFLQQAPKRLGVFAFSY